MAKRRYTKRNTEPIFTLSELEQYGFGDWLKKNAAPIGMGIGALGAIALTGGLAAPVVAPALAGTIGAGAATAGAVGGLGALGAASLGSSIGGSIGGAVQKSSEQDEQNNLIAEQNRQQQAMMQQQQFNQNNKQIQNTPVFKYGGELRKYPNGGKMPEKDPYYSEYTKRLEEVKPVLQDKAELYYYTQQLDKQLREKNPKVYDELTSQYGYNPDKPLSTKTRTQAADTYAKNNPDFYLSPEEQSTYLKDKYQRYNELRGKYGKDYNLLGEGDDPTKPETWKVGARHAVAFNPVTYDYTKKAPENSLADKKTSNFKYSLQYDPLQENPYISNTEYKQFANGGYVMEYGGASHARGGIPVDGTTGNPTSIMGSSPDAEVEDNEVAVKFPKEKTPFIFSDRLGFASQAKKIQNKYSKRPNDSISQDVMYSELGGLMQEQEAFKAKKMQYHQNKMMEFGGPLLGDNIIGNQDYQYSRGGKLPKYDGLGEQDQYLPDSTLLNATNPELSLLGNTNYSQSGSLDPLNPELSGLGSNKFSTEPKNEYSPYRGSAAPMIASGISNLALLAMNKKPEPMRANTINPELINLESARTGVKENAVNSRANRLKALREAGLTPSQYASLIGAGDADINRSTNESLRQSYLNEQMQNAQSKGRANEFNAQQIAETNRTNLGLKDQYKRQNMQYLQNIAESIPAYFGQRESYDIANAKDPNMIMAKDKYGRLKYIPKSKE